jgi:hypothetical protein
MMVDSRHIGKAQKFPDKFSDTSERLKKIQQRFPAHRKTSKNPRQVFRHIGKAQKNPGKIPDASERLKKFQGSFPMHREGGCVKNRAAARLAFGVVEV